MVRLGEFPGDAANAFVVDGGSRDRREASGRSVRPFARRESERLSPVAGREPVAGCERIRKKAARDVIGAQTEHAIGWDFVNR